MEQKIITIADDIVRSVGYSKIATNFNVEQFVLEKFPDISRPEMPEDMQKWLECNELSSKKMKNYLSNGEGTNGVKNGKQS